MKTKLILAVIVIIGIVSSCNQKTEKNDKKVETPDNPLIGKWIRVGHYGPISFDFKENGLVEGDFGNDQTIDVVANYELSGDTIQFIDKEGKMCRDNGKYKIYQTDYYLAFDLIEDNCGGRIKITTGFWTKPDFNDLITKLEKEMSNSSKPDLYLNRGRLYMAIGKTKQAKGDFDTYILADSLNARVYVNRAGTRFPDDMEGVVFDCNKAISIDPNNKNAYFLRGLAWYELGEKEKGCEDFSKAIKLGFSVLKIAEQEKCAEFWNEE
jgi:tetratricopeptide (TPR) repeat protein